jgi:hypothetical protein
MMYGYDVAINNSSGQITNQIKLSKVVSLKFSSTDDSICNNYAYLSM